MSENTILELTAAQRSDLRAKAHHLKPVIMIGESGLTPAVLAETERALATHGLIKLRVLGDDRDQRLQILADVCAELGCAKVQIIGKLLVVYRPLPPVKASTGRDGPHVPKKVAAVGGKAKAKPSKPSARKTVRAKAPGAKGPVGKKASGAKGPARKTASSRGAAGKAPPSRIRFQDDDDAPAPRRSSAGVVWRKDIDTGRPTTHKPRPAKAGTGASRAPARSGPRPATPRAGGSRAGAPPARGRKR